MLNCSYEHSLSPCFIQQIFISLFLTGLGPWGDGTMPQPLQNWQPSTVNVLMVSFYAWGALGVYWLFQNEAILLFFMIHFHLHILTKLSLFVYFPGYAWDFAIQITAMDIGGHEAAPGQRKNRSLLYVLHNLLLR